MTYREQYEKETGDRADFGYNDNGELEFREEYVIYLESRLSRCEGVIEEMFLMDCNLEPEDCNELRKQAGMGEK